MSFSGVQQQQSPIDQYKKQFDDICADVDRRLSPYPIFQKAQESTGVRPAFFVLGLCLFFLGFALFGLGAHAVCNLVGFVYPAYASIIALKTECKQDDVHWLTYWVVYAFFNVLESITDALMYWIPFYYLVKVALLIWMYAPQTRGAERIFVTLIEPAMAKYDEAFNPSAAQQAKQSAQSVRSHLENAGSELSSLKSKVLNSKME